MPQSKAAGKIKGKDAKPAAAEVTKLRAMLVKRSKATKATDLDALLSGATGKERKALVGDLIAWLKERPKAK